MAAIISIIYLLNNDKLFALTKNKTLKMIENCSI